MGAVPFQPRDLFSIVECITRISRSTTEEPRQKFTTTIVSADHRLNRRQQRRREPASELAKLTVKKATAGNPLVQSTRVQRPDVSYAYEYIGVLCGGVPELHAIPVSPRWGKTLKRESRSAQAEAVDYEQAPQRIGVQPDVESIRDEVEGMQQAEQEFCERGTEGAGEPANATDEGVMTP
mgnify:CR=1 FL=1